MSFFHLQRKCFTLMNEHKQNILFSMLLIAFMGTYYWVLSPCQEANADNHLPLPNEKEYTEKVNQWLLENKQAHDIANKNKTPEKKAREEAFGLRLLSGTQGAIKNISFYGKIVDQYGSPVVGVKIKYKAISRYLATGTGFGHTTTNNEGCFNTDGAKGAGLSIRAFTNPGYQFSGVQNFDSFQRFEDSVLWKDLTKDKPYVFKAWKIGHYPPNHIRITHWVAPDGKTYRFSVSHPVR